MSLSPRSRFDSARTARRTASAWPRDPGRNRTCGSPTVLINVIATNNDGSSSVVHITIADQEVPAAVPPDVVDRIGESFRPAD